MKVEHFGFLHSCWQRGYFVSQHLPHKIFLQETQRITSVSGLGKISQFLQTNLFLKDIVTSQSTFLSKFSIFSNNVLGNSDAWETYKKLSNFTGIVLSRLLSMLSSRKEGKKRSLSSVLSFSVILVISRHRQPGHNNHSEVTPSRHFAFWKDFEHLNLLLST